MPAGRGPAQRGRALGIAFAGTGLGSLVFVPLANWLIAQFDWRSAYLDSGAGLPRSCSLPLMVIGLRKPPAAPAPPRHSHSQRPAGKWRQRLLREPVFWALMLVGLTALAPVRSLTVHQIAYMESAGIERERRRQYRRLGRFANQS